MVVNKLLPGTNSSALGFIEDGVTAGLMRAGTRLEIKDMV